ncbi:hypothetical protein MBLNU459_g4171t2 [Dothideomycetes sp. NU459]
MKMMKKKSHKKPAELMTKRKREEDTTSINAKKQKLSKDLIHTSPIHALAPAAIDSSATSWANASEAGLACRNARGAPAPPESLQDTQKFIQAIWGEASVVHFGKFIDTLVARRAQMEMASDLPSDEMLRAATGELAEFARLTAKISKQNAYHDLRDLERVKIISSFGGCMISSSSGWRIPLRTSLEEFEIFWPNLNYGDEELDKKRRVLSHQLLVAKSLHHLVNAFGTGIMVLLQGAAWDTIIDYINFEQFRDIINVLATDPLLRLVCERPWNNVLFFLHRPKPVIPPNLGILDMSREERKSAYFLDLVATHSDADAEYVEVPAVLHNFPQPEHDDEGDDEGDGNQDRDVLKQETVEDLGAIRAPKVGDHWDPADIQPEVRGYEQIPASRYSN